MGLKEIGIAVCVVGTILAILFVPCTGGLTSWGWHFILGEFCRHGRGCGISPIKWLDTTTLLLELILINGVGLALYYFGMKQEEK